DQFAGELGTSASLRASAPQRAYQTTTQSDQWGWRSPNPPEINRRLLVSDCHIPECICRMARPIMFWAQTDTALLVLALVVVAERIASSFSRRVIKPASRKNAPCGFYIFTALTLDAEASRLTKLHTRDNRAR